ncbi:hypothetical protein D3C76_1525390 [compost metagenome]
MPALHVFRLTATGVLLALATHFALDFKDFLLFYVVQVSAVYLLDLLFAHFLIVHAVRNGAAAMGES